MSQCPEGLKSWTVDEVAECLPYEIHIADIKADKRAGDALYAKLWRLLAEAKDKTPIGGDGSDGTVEYPDARDGDNDDKMGAVWEKLTEDEQNAIAKAFEEENTF